MRKIVFILAFLMISSPLFATDYVVHVGGDVQAAINSATCGDTITLDTEASGSYSTSGFTLPQLTGVSCTGTDADYVTIRPSDWASLPANGERIGPGDTALFSKIVGTGSGNIFQTTADYWKITGLEIVNTAGVYKPTFVYLHGLGANFILDHSYMHPAECPNDTSPYNTSGRFAVDIEAYDHVTLSNSYFDCWWGTPLGGGVGSSGQDNQTITSVAGDYLTIYNNYLTGGYDCIFLGGGTNLGSSNTATVSASPAPTTTTATLSNTTNLQIGDFMSFLVPGPPSQPTVSIWTGGTGIANGDIVQVSVAYLNSSYTDRQAMSSVRTITNTSGAAAGLTVTAPASEAGIDRWGVYACDQTTTSCSFQANNGVHVTNFTLQGALQSTFSGTVNFNFTTTGQQSVGYCWQPSGTNCWAAAKVTNISGNDVTFANLAGRGDFGGINFAPANPPNVTGSARWRGYRVSNVTVQQNYLNLYTPYHQWQYDHTGFPGKNYLEVKDCTNCTFYGNVMQGMPLTVSFIVQNQDGSQPWATMNALSFDSNWVKDFGGSGADTLGYTTWTTPPVTGPSFTNNVFGYSSSNWGLSGLFTMTWVGGGSAGHTITHNDFLMGIQYGSSDQYVQNCLRPGHVGNTTYYSDPVVIVRNNIMGFTYYGNFVGSCSGGVMSGCANPYTEDHNIIVENSVPPNGDPSNSNQFPNSYATYGVVQHWTNMNFTDGSTDNYKLTASSPGYQAASDSTDVGVDWATFSSAISGVESGNLLGGGGTIVNGSVNIQGSATIR